MTSDDAKDNTDAAMRSSKRQAAPMRLDKRAAVRFVVVFVVLLGLFYIPYSIVSQTDAYSARYLSVIARVASEVLNLLGQETKATGALMASPDLAFRIVPGCDGLEPFALFGSAVLAAPVALRARLIFLVLGTTALAIVNLLRIVTLFMIGVFYPDTFRAMHGDLWPGFIIVAVLVCWLTWARWILRRQSVASHEAD